MAFSREKKFIFIKINKTGGTSVQRQLVRLVPDLQREAHRALHDYDVDLDDWFVFTFVRNPWDKMVSFYEFHRSRGFDLLPPRGGAPRAPSFKEFVLRDVHDMVFDKPAGLSSRTMRASNQLDWVRDKRGVVRADFIGRFERLQEDFDAVCRRLGLPSEALPHLRRSERRPYQGYYDDETREAVARAFADDLSALGYAFDGP